MKKILIACVLSAVMVISLAACSSGGGTNTGTDTGTDTGTSQAA